MSRMICQVAFAGVIPPAVSRAAWAYRTMRTSQPCQVVGGAIVIMIDDANVVP